MSDLPLVIRVLHERLHFHYRGPQRLARFEVFLIDLADWKLSLTDRTPCVWVRKPEHQNAPALDLADEIRDAVRQANWHSDVVLVLIDWLAPESAAGVERGLYARRTLHPICRHRFHAAARHLRRRLAHAPDAGHLARSDSAGAVVAVRN